MSILPQLLKTQDKFLSVLNLSDRSPDAWKRFVDQSEDMSANLLLKHLMVLSDIGRETASKLVPLNRFFEQDYMRYIWREQVFEYAFQNLHRAAAFTNKSLGIEPTDLVKGLPLTAKMEDLIMLLLHGATAIGDTLPGHEKERCQIGSMIGEPEQLKRFVQENYIRVSTQLRGASSNASGHIAQNFVKTTLEQALPDWRVRSGHIPGITHDDAGTETTFDIVAHSPNGIYFAVEVGFQVTTNSVIERKSGQAQARARLLHQAGHYICYVIDGAGNLNFRERAVRIIMQFSDYTIAFSKAEVLRLAEYMQATAAMQGAGA